MSVVGLGGFGGSGKSTGARFLVAEHGWEERSYAEKIRDYMLDVNPWLPDGRRWAEVFHEVGYDLAKETVPGFRQSMVDIGDGARRIIGTNVWVDAAVRCLNPAADSVFVDVRYHNEIDALRDRGGVLIWVDRPGVGPALDADGVPLVSEVTVGPDDFDHVVVNDGTPQHLAAIIRAITMLHYGQSEQVAA